MWLLYLLCVRFSFVSVVHCCAQTLKVSIFICACRRERPTVAYLPFCTWILWTSYGWKTTTTVPGKLAQWHHCNGGYFSVYCSSFSHIYCRRVSGWCLTRPSPLTQHRQRPESFCKCRIAPDTLMWYHEYLWHQGNSSFIWIELTLKTDLHGWGLYLRWFYRPVLTAFFFGVFCWTFNLSHNFIYNRSPFLAKCYVSLISDYTVSDMQSKGIWRVPPLPWMKRLVNQPWESLVIIFSKRKRHEISWA